MPLNPNGKVDKPKLPFPDTAQAVPREAPPMSNKATLTPTQKTLSDIWAKLLPNTPSPIPIEENFFDVGGHSILATRLIFEIRRVFVVDAPLSLIFDKPTIHGLSDAIDALRNDDFAFNAPLGPPPEVNEPKLDYATDYETLTGSLASTYEAVKEIPSGEKLTIFLTGGTGFLGSFILTHLLGLEQTKQVICLVRGKDDADALERLRSSAQDRGVWNDEWTADGSKKVTVVTGDLSEPRFGLSESLWDELCQSVDAVVHNGALVNPFSCS